MQCSKNHVNIVILDNASTNPISSIIEEKYPQYKDIIEVHRNPVNIGADANICRCFEMAKSEWFWLLGDDDMPSLDAVATILAEISTADAHCGYICFSTNKRAFSVKTVINHSNKYWSLINQYDALCNMSFISSGVYKSQFSQACLMPTIQSIHTCFSQLVMQREMVASGKSMILSPSFVCDWRDADEGQHWNQTKVMSGIPYLYDLKGFGCQSRRALTKLFVNCRPRPFLTWILDQAKSSDPVNLEYSARLLSRLKVVARRKFWVSCCLGSILCQMKRTAIKFSLSSKN